MRQLQGGGSAGGVKSTTQPRAHPHPRAHAAAPLAPPACGQVSTRKQGRPALTPLIFRVKIAGLQRQVIYGGLRIGLYEPIKTLFAGKDAGDASLSIKILAGLTTGALGISVASPTDLVKVSLAPAQSVSPHCHVMPAPLAFRALLEQVRMQAAGQLPDGHPRKYPSALAAYGRIVKTEGVAALWTGLGPNIARNAIINAAELASYDQIKQSLLQ